MDMQLNLYQKGEIKAFLEERNISFLVHFTPKENLDSIRKNGLVLRNKLPSLAVVTDSKRYDGGDGICLSISKPNFRMLKKKYDQGFDLALLILKKEILYEKKCLFFPHNAASAEYRNKHISEFIGVNALKKLFLSSFSVQLSQKESYFDRVDLELSETTSEQAEIQCFESIAPENIIYIFEKYIPDTYSELRLALKDIINFSFVEEIDYKDDLINIESNAPSVISRIDSNVSLELDKTKGTLGGAISSIFSTAIELDTIPYSVNREIKISEALADKDKDNIFNEESILDDKIDGYKMETSNKLELKDRNHNSDFSGCLFTIFLFIILIFILR